MAHVGLADAGVAAVCRRDLFPAGESLWTRGVSRAAGTDLGGLEKRPGAHRTIQHQRVGATSGAYRQPARRHGFRGGGKRLQLLAAYVRFAPGRLRTSAEVSASRYAQLPAALLVADQEPGGTGYGAGDAAGDGQGRHERSAGRRIPSLFGGRILVRAALRKDAV